MWSGSLETTAKCSQSTSKKFTMGQKLFKFGHGLFLLIRCHGPRPIPIARGIASKDTQGPMLDVMAHFECFTQPASNRLWQSFVVNCRLDLGHDHGSLFRLVVIRRRAQFLCFRRSVGRRFVACGVERSRQLLHLLQPCSCFRLVRVGVRGVGVFLTLRARYLRFRCGVGRRFVTCGVECIHPHSQHRRQPCSCSRLIGVLLRLRLFLTLRELSLCSRCRASSGTNELCCFAQMRVNLPKHVVLGGGFFQLCRMGGIRQ